MNLGNDKYRQELVALALIVQDMQPLDLCQAVKGKCQKSANKTWLGSAFNALGHLKLC